MSENVGLLLRLQAEGRAPKVGDVVRLYVSRRGAYPATVDAVRVVAHKHRVVVYIEADGRTFETPPVTGWYAWHGTGKDSVRMAPSIGDANAARAALGVVEES